MLASTVVRSRVAVVVSSLLLLATLFAFLSTDDQATTSSKTSTTVQLLADESAATTTGTCSWMTGFNCPAWSNAQCSMWEGKCKCPSGTFNIRKVHDGARDIAVDAQVCAPKVVPFPPNPSPPINPVTVSEPAKKAKGVAMSGGGFRAFAAALGSYRSLYDEGMLDELSAVSANSGGNWFTTQFAFSSDVYKRVTTQRPGEAYAALFDQWAEYYRNHHFGPTTTIQVGWHQYSNYLMNSMTPDIATRTAETSGRAGYTVPDVLSLIALPGMAWVDVERWTKDYLSGKSATILDAPANNTLALAWKSAGQNSTEQSEWFFPRSKWVGDANAPTEASNRIHVRSQDKIEPLNLVHTPNVGTIAAASSAALGYTTSVIDSAVMESDQSSAEATKKALEDVSDTAATDFKKGVSDFFTNVLKDNMVSKMGVCSNGQIEDCKFPSTRLIDGAYADNTALPILVGHLQAKHGRDTELELIMQSSTPCDNKAHCEKQAKYSSDSPLNFFDTPEGNREWTDTGALRAPSPRRKIFAGQPPKLQKVSGDNDHWYAVGRFTTVANDDFGVIPGTTVKLLFFYPNAQGLGTKDSTSGKYDGGTMPTPDQKGESFGMDKHADSTRESLQALLKLTTA